MKINMSEIHFNKFIELCRKSKYEISGIMNTKVVFDEIFVVGIKLDDDEVIDEVKRNSIHYKFKEYLTKTVYELAFTNSPVYIRFHTHPSFDGAPALSKADIDNLKYVQSLTKKVAKINANNCTKVIEGIITRSEIAFYTYDLDSDKIIRLPFFVDGIEKIPSIEKNILQLFKESFTGGMGKARK